VEAFAAGPVVAEPPAPELPAPPAPELEAPLPVAPEQPELSPSLDAVAEATPPGAALPLPVLPERVPAEAPAPALPLEPAAPRAWRAPDVPPLPAEPLSVEAAPAVQAPPPVPPAGVVPLAGPAPAAGAQPRSLEQAAPVPVAPAGQRRVAPILVGGIAAVLLLLAGAAFLFRPPAPPAAPTPTTLPATLVVAVPSEAPATPAPALTPPPTEAAPATAATVVAAADTATAGPPSATPTAGAVAAAPTPAGTLRRQDAFDPLPAPAPAEYDAYALLSSSGLENDIDNLNTPGSTAGFQNPGTYRIALDGANQSRAVALARFAYSAFSLQIDLADASDAAAAGNLGQGVVVRERDRDHFYAVLLDARNGQYAVRKLDGPDHWSDLVPWTAAPGIQPRGTANRLRVDGAGDEFTVYLNDALLAHFSDGAYQSGMLGLIGTNLDATKSVFDFDNLGIWSSDPAGPAATLDANRGMIRIPGGEFIMGWYAKPEEQAHMVDVPPFYLDATEVTNKAYRECVAAGKCTPPAAPPPGDAHANYFRQAQFDSYPVVYVAWTQAQAYCTWAQKRLPTEAEWEKAAGWDSTAQVKAVWPWADNRFDPQRLNSQESNPGYTTAVRQFGPELNGTFDMAGNVREWTSSLAQPYPYNAADGREDLGAPDARIYRGGSWLHTWGKAQTFFREGSPPDEQVSDVGFRCAATP
jgi:formylglycine-generating enzyme required for sulfatase activity